MIDQGFMLFINQTQIIKKLLIIFSFLFLGLNTLLAQMPDAPERTEGEGPFERLIIRGVNLIDGTGAPMQGPVDVVVEGNRIVGIHTVGYPGLPINENRRPKAGSNDKILEAEGLYMLPGFFDMHAHTGGNAQGTLLNMSISFGWRTGSLLSANRDLSMGWNGPFVINS